MLLIAARRGDAAMVTALIAAAGGGLDVNLSAREWRSGRLNGENGNPYGVNPLRQAAKIDGVDVINALLAADGIEVDAADDRGRTALMNAAIEGIMRHSGRYWPRMV